MENPVSNSNSLPTNRKIALTIAIAIAIEPKKAIAIVVSILLIISDLHSKARGVHKGDSNKSDKTTE